MRSFTRTFVSTSALLAALTVAPAAFAGNGDALLSYVPEGTDAVVAVNVERLRSTTVYGDMTDLATGMREYRDTIGTLTANGVSFDPTTDVSTMVIAIPNLNAAPTSRQGVLLVEAEFDTAQVIAAAQANNYTVLTEGSIQYFVARENTVAILAPGIVAVGDSATVQSIIAGDTGAGRSLNGQIRAADKGDTIWFAAAGSRAGYSAAHGSLDLSSGLVGTLVATMGSAAEATERVATATTSISSLASDPTVAALGLATTLSGLTVSSNDDEVTFSLTLDAATWSSLATRLLAIAESEL